MKYRHRAIHIHEKIWKIYKCTSVAPWSQNDCNKQQLLQQPQPLAGSEAEVIFIFLKTLKYKCLDHNFQNYHQKGPSEPTSMACSSVGGGEFFQHFWRHTEILNDLCNLFPPPSLLFPPPSPLFPPPGGGRWRICSHNLPHWSRHTQLFRWVREKVESKPRSAQDRGLTSWPGLSRASHPRSLVVGPRSAFIDNCCNVFI